MDKPLSFDEIRDIDGELCKHCEWTEFGEDMESRYPTGPLTLGCEGSGCKKAYENYLEDFEEENVEMTNIEKAEKANELAEDIKLHSKNIKCIQARKEMFEKNRDFLVSLKGFNQDININADGELIQLMILTEHARIEKAEKELDELLNGDVNRIKNMLNEECK
ncbi:hypothetical protein [uncultured Clostridium sp.]|uniref:hypothetical protein n=1 Tax=uncultured Clostridium sp. TaxID=59620 RepID=UPI0025D85ACB|nr:hypothetical protein [uncultured Clostridium sp.]